MTTTASRVYELCDVIALAQTKIQQEFSTIDPLVGINSGLRASGFAADAITIDCLKSGKRIILISHDDSPEQIDYQFSYKNTDPSDHFEHIALKELTMQQCYQWMKDYFAEA